MRLRRVEWESLLKSFFLFLGSLTFLLALLFYNIYTKERLNLEKHLFERMRVCSLDLKCKDFGFDFVEAKARELYLLRQDAQSLYAYFPIPGSRKYLMKISYPKERFDADLAAIRRGLLGEFFRYFAGLALLSALFSLYALHPLRQAMKMTEEFVKDILHDFNTPLSVVRLNVRMLKRQIPGERKVERIEEAVETLLRLQANLRTYLGGHTLQTERFDLASLVEERAALMQRAYPDIRFAVEVPSWIVETQPDAMRRVLDNLLDNAAKYNRPGGRVTVRGLAKSRRLVIEDTGIGIRHPSRVFERFYKEHERGLGIGLHIVRKLAEAMGITVGVTSRPGEGSTFWLDLDRITVRDGR